MHSSIEQFSAAIRSAGLSPPETIEPGRWHRFPGSQKGARNRAGWCYLFDDLKGGFFGDHSTASHHHWKSTEGKHLSDADWERYRQRIDAMKAQRDAEQAKREQHARQTASAMWQAAAPAMQHEYLAPRRPV